MPHVIFVWTELTVMGKVEFDLINSIVFQKYSKETEIQKYFMQLILVFGLLLGVAFIQVFGKWWPSPQTYRNY